MHILKGNGLDCHTRRLISKLHMDQSTELRLDQGQKTRIMIEIGVRKGCCFSQILFNLCSEYLTSEALEWFGGNLHCEICRQICITGKETNGVTGHD